MKTYVLPVDIEHDPADGIWEAEIPALPGCAVWGYSKVEALEALEEAAKAYLEVSLYHGDPLPPEINSESSEFNGQDKEVLAISV